jgi:molybdopterin converting factor small subunit
MTGKRTVHLKFTGSLIGQLGIRETDIECGEKATFLDLREELERQIPVFSGNSLSKYLVFMSEGKIIQDPKEEIGEKGEISVFLPVFGG